jgi:protein-tyrosine phosphatase
MAGEYPIVRDPDQAYRKLSGILAAGIDDFLDLTGEEDRLDPYHKLETERPFGHRRLTIRDMDVPSPSQMRHILDHLQQRLQAGRTVYVHCWGGIGRTGTVVGCYLIETGLTPQQALDTIADRWQTMEKRVRFSRSPQTDAQIQFVLDWKA